MKFFALFSQYRHTATDIKSKKISFLKSMDGISRLCSSSSSFMTNQALFTFILWSISLDQFHSRTIKNKEALFLFNFIYWFSMSFKCKELQSSMMSKSLEVRCHMFIIVWHNRPWFWGVISRVKCNWQKILHMFDSILVYRLKWSMWSNLINSGWARSCQVRPSYIHL